MHDVFISHARDDSEFVKRLGEDLRSQGISAWIAENFVEPGTRWANSIEKAIGDSRNVLFILSEKSNESGWLRAEAALALTQAGKRLIPIYHSKNAEVPFLLRSFKGMDFSTPSAYPAQVEQLALLLRSKNASPENIESTYSAWRDFVGAESAVLSREMRLYEARARYTHNVISSGLLKVASIAGLLGLVSALGSAVLPWSTVAMVSIAGAAVGAGFAATSIVIHIRLYEKPDESTE